MHSTFNTQQRSSQIEKIQQNVIENIALNILDFEQAQAR